MKVYVVTGGARGIGRAIAKRLIDGGGKVVIADRDAAAGKDAEEEYGERVKFVRGDAGKEADVKRAVATAVKWGGRLDGAVANAGIASPDVGPTEKLSLATWNAFLTTNLTGAFLLAKHAIPALREAKGAMVLMGSIRAVQSEPDTIAYAASKGGIAALSHALAVSLGPDIRVNCVEPGWIATSTYAPRKERTQPKLRKQDHAQHPVGRVGIPEDIASLTAWLLSDEAGFVTGATFVSDGGMTRKMVYEP